MAESAAERRHLAGRLIVRAASGSDAWRTTSYGFVRDSAHALLSDLPDGWAVQVSFLADFDQQFDQAGVLVRIDETDVGPRPVSSSATGALQASAVVTDGVSDWSVGAGPGLGRQRGDGAGQPVRDRADRPDQGRRPTPGGCCGWRRSTRPQSPTPGPTAAPRSGTVSTVTFTGWTAGRPTRRCIRRLDGRPQG